ASALYKYPATRCKNQLERSTRPNMLVSFHPFTNILCVIFHPLIFTSVSRLELIDLKKPYS
ncbi:hypothetical protein, partial [Vibrio tasmaniensis]|uniref:hypothetical protein n=1 Tax=Vibrio tasmaniensis TaxID=212663 RepID=UPI0019D6C7E9